MRLWKAIVRCSVALLLLSTFVAPAVAEIACAQGCIEEISLDHSDSGELEAPDDRSSDDSGGATGTVSHCAFGSAGCAGILIEPPRSVVASAMSTRFMVSTAVALAPSGPDRPERPPQA